MSRYRSMLGSEAGAHSDRASSFTAESTLSIRPSPWNHHRTTRLGARGAISGPCKHQPEAPKTMPNRPQDRFSRHDRFTRDAGRDGRRNMEVDESDTRSLAACSSEQVRML